MLKHVLNPAGTIDPTPTLCNILSPNTIRVKVPFCKKEKLKVASCYSVTNWWNKIDKQTKKIEKLGKFKHELMSEYFKNYRSEKTCTIKNCYACSIAVR